MANKLTLGKERRVSELAELLKALADPSRLEIVQQVLSSDGGEACVCDLTDAAGLTQGTVSHHLRVLVDAGILEREQRGRWAFYSLNESSRELADALGLKKSLSAKKRC